ncbi:MAG TPA: helix-turn-helix transcriptional regulator [Gallicola sp.]|nr:helix-turn-helix transcriptional regulator [Gallicola sp.]
MRKAAKKTQKHLPYNRLKAALVERGLTQDHIAKLLNLSKSTVNQKINGSLDFTFSEVEKICDDLSVSTDIFLTKSYTSVTKVG